MRRSPLRSHLLLAARFGPYNVSHPRAVKTKMSNYPRKRPGAK